MAFRRSIDLKLSILDVCQSPGHDYADLYFLSRMSIFTKIYLNYKKS